MSQAGILSLSSGPIPPTIATSYIADIGTAVPSGNVLDVLGRGSIDNDVDGIRTQAAPNPSQFLYVELTNRLQGTGTTVGAATTNLISFALDNVTPSAYKFEFNLVAFNSATPAAAGYNIQATARTTGVGNVATIVSTPDGDEDEDAALVAADWNVVAIANSVILTVTGVAGLTINWSAVGYYVKVS